MRFLRAIGRQISYKSLVSLFVCCTRQQLLLLVFRHDDVENYSPKSSKYICIFDNFIGASVATAV